MVNLGPLRSRTPEYKKEVEYLFDILPGMLVAKAQTLILQAGFSYREAGSPSHYNFYDPFTISLHYVHVGENAYVDKTGIRIG